jgi:hypothetical protein
VAAKSQRGLSFNELTNTCPNNAAQEATPDARIFNIPEFSPRIPPCMITGLPTQLHPQNKPHPRRGRRHVPATLKNDRVARNKLSGSSASHFGPYEPTSQFHPIVSEANTLQHFVIGRKSADPAGPLNRLVFSNFASLDNLILPTGSRGYKFDDLMESVSCHSECATVRHPVVATDAVTDCSFSEEKTYRKDHRDCLQIRFLRVLIPSSANQERFQIACETSIVVVPPSAQNVRLRP